MAGEAQWVHCSQSPSDIMIPAAIWLALRDDCSGSSSCFVCKPGKVQTMRSPCAYAQCFDLTVAQIPHPCIFLAILGQQPLLFKREVDKKAYRKHIFAFESPFTKPVTEKTAAGLDSS